MPDLSPPKVTVVGSLNVDYFARVSHFPAPGETVAGEDLTIRFGGKGANQAVAAASLGASVEMIGRVGADTMGARYLDRLSEMGIGTEGVSEMNGEATGSAFITLDAEGENTIVVVPGANGSVDRGAVAGARQVAEADVLLLQNEVSHEANVEACRLAREAKVFTIYNPAPWDAGRDLGNLSADLIVANELEAERMAEVGFSAEKLVVTRGGKSTLANWEGREIKVPPEAVEAIDTVGAGDTFVGALAVKLGKGVEPEEAIRFANRAAALAIGKVGAQEAMPSAEQVEAFGSRS